LADIIQNSSVERASITDTPHKLRRQKYVMARTTVGGQFCRQLRYLRDKIDEMSPHYIRCLKPNDELIPDHFDQAAVAERLRCGGILEAVRVAPAGFSNHYPHSDFLRCYRCLGWDELKPKQVAGGFTSTPQPTKKKWEPPVVSAAFRSHNSYSQPNSSASDAKSDATTLCKELIKILYRNKYSMKESKRKGARDPSTKSPAKSDFFANFVLEESR
jgi:hypothetical protein